MDLAQLLALSSARHKHLCPRQVLGVRLGVLGGKLLGMDLPRQDKKLLVLVETDGCFADGVEVATGCTLGHRSLRLMDYGKIGATFVEVKTGRAVRIAPRPEVREQALLYAPDEPRHYFAQLAGYQVMPDEVLFQWVWVQLTRPVSDILSRPGVRVNCDQCGEEIINEREVVQNGRFLCQACAGQAYYTPLAERCEAG